MYIYIYICICIYIYIYTWRPLTSLGRRKYFKRTGHGWGTDEPL